MNPQRGALNGICPYFTMFPLPFPLGVLRRAAAGDWVLDPFSGRGTTSYAARLRGLPSVGVDSSPVAHALTAAKLVSPTPEAIVTAAEELLAGGPPRETPEGEFWGRAFRPEVLAALCRLREGLRRDSGAPERVALRAILLGALHGPLGKRRATYFSNQCPRTFAPKPAYAARFWRERGMEPPPADVLRIVRERAERYYATPGPETVGAARLADSRTADLAASLPREARVGWVVTSPPYYGMRTYVPDQWLRAWFLGGPATVDYAMDGQLRHSSPEVFAGELADVWRNVGRVCRPGARLVVRYGGISDRKAAPLGILRESLRGTGWRVQTHRSAGTAAAGKRQAEQFRTTRRGPIEERDLWAVWEG